jgi:hypothetical protein
MRIRFVEQQGDRHGFGKSGDQAAFRRRAWLRRTRCCQRRLLWRAYGRTHAGPLDRSHGLFLCFPRRKTLAGGADGVCDGKRPPFGPGFVVPYDKLPCCSNSSRFRWRPEIPEGLFLGVGKFPAAYNPTALLTPFRSPEFTSAKFVARYFLEFPTWLKSHRQLLTRPLHQARPNRH